jgi:hypothetical protein
MVVLLIVKYLNYLVDYEIFFCTFVFYRVICASYNKWLFVLYVALVYLPNLKLGNFNSITIGEKQNLHF